MMIIIAITSFSWTIFAGEQALRAQEEKGRYIWMRYPMRVGVCRGVLVLVRCDGDRMRSGFR